MNIKDERNRHFNIDGPKVRCAKQLESKQLQTAVEAFKANGGKIDIIPIGMSSYMNDMEKARHQRKVKYGRHHK